MKFTRAIQTSFRRYTFQKQETIASSLFGSHLRLCTSWHKCLTVHGAVVAPGRSQTCLWVSLCKTKRNLPSVLSEWIHDSGGGGGFKAAALCACLFPRECDAWEERAERTEAARLAPRRPAPPTPPARVGERGNQSVTASTLIGSAQYGHLSLQLQHSTCDRKGPSTCLSSQRMSFCEKTHKVP